MPRRTTRMNSLLTLSLIVGLSSLSSVASLHAPIKRAESAHSTSVKFNSMLATNESNPYGFGNVNAGGPQQIYIVTVKVAGEEFEVRFFFYCTEEMLTFSFVRYVYRSNWILAARTCGSILKAWICRRIRTLGR